MAACPECAGTEDLEEDLNVDDDDPGQHDEMADLCELTLQDLMALRTKCGRWLKHIELEIEERRQEQQDIMDQQEAEREAEAARHGRLRAELDPQAPQYVPFVNRPFESEIHGTVNFTQFYCVLLVTWCYRVLLSCYLRPK